MLNHQNQLANFTPANGGGFVQAGSGGWFSRSLIHPDKNDWAPRLGFSYSPFQKIVLRGGYGIFYQHDVRIGSESVIAENHPAFLDQALSQSLGSTTPVLQLNNGFPASQFGTAAVDFTKLQNSSAGSESAHPVCRAGQLRSAVQALGGHRPGRLLRW